VPTKQKDGKKSVKTAAGQRPVLQFRVHEDVYDALKKSAALKKLTVSEDAAMRIGKTLSLDEQDLTLENLKQLGIREFLMGNGYTQVRDEDGHELWTKGAPAVAKYMKLAPEIEAIIDRAIEKALQRSSK